MFFAKTRKTQKKCKKKYKIIRLCTLAIGIAKKISKKIDQKSSKIGKNWKSDQKNAKFFEKVFSKSL
jgi:hypothetical protein